MLWVGLSKTGSHSGRRDEYHLREQCHQHGAFPASRRSNDHVDAPRLEEQLALDLEFEVAPSRSHSPRWLFCPSEGCISEANGVWRRCVRGFDGERVSL